MEEVVGICQGCGVFTDLIGHECPFQAELNQDYTVCYCCSSCESRCAEDI